MMCRLSGSARFFAADGATPLREAQRERQPEMVDLLRRNGGHE